MQPRRARSIPSNEDTVWSVFNTQHSPLLFSLKIKKINKQNCTKAAVQMNFHFFFSPKSK